MERKLTFDARARTTKDDELLVKSPLVAVEVDEALAGNFDAVHLGGGESRENSHVESGWEWLKEAEGKLVEWFWVVDMENGKQCLEQGAVTRGKARCAMEEAGGRVGCSDKAEKKRLYRREANAERNVYV